MNFNLFSKGPKGKICVIAEKYDVARQYAEALGCERVNGVFENNKYVIVWTNGHVATLYDPEDYDGKYKKWRMEDLPILPNGFWVKLRENKGQILNQIKKNIEREDITAVCIATDSAREGNLIGEYLLMAIENKKPTYRVMISAPNRKDIIDGFKNIEPSEKYANLTLAAQARDEVDWIIGYNFSRAYSIMHKEKFYIGRCKTVILSILCKREEEIINSKQSIYYTISGEFLGNREKYSGNLQEEVLSAPEAEWFKNFIGKEGRIKKITKQKKTVPPPKLFNMNDLLRAANRRFGYSSEETYYIAQNLYEKYKLISYARTDSNYVKKSMMPEIKMTLKWIKGEKNHTENYGIKYISSFIDRCVDDSKVAEHSAIIPLYIPNEELNKVLENLPLTEKNVYELIKENFINNFLEDYIYETQNIETEVEGHIFKTNIFIPQVSGWKGNKILQDHPNNEIRMQEGDLVSCKDIKVEKKLTSLPSRYTDDTLLEILGNPGKFVEDKKLKCILKENGIGTDATRALLIKDLLNNEYIIRDKKYIVVTPMGQRLIEAIKNKKLKQPFFTAEIEDELQKIQEGEKNKDVLIKEVMKFVSEEIEALKSNYYSEDERRVIGICPRCHTGKVMENSDGKGYGCTNVKIGCRFYVSKHILGVTLDKAQISKLIVNRETDSFLFLGKDSSFNAKLTLDKDNNTKFRRIR